MNANHIRELGRATLSGSLPFHEIVGKLIAEGVEYYQVDYVTLQMSFYGAEGGVVVVPLTFESVPPIAEVFDAPALRAAILDSQKNGQKFRDFSRRAAEAGVAAYFAFLRGQRVTYLGRQGDHHVEWFPGAKPTEA
jgi:uncharacterized protein YbcV (DUF1398 family)